MKNAIAQAAASYAAAWAERDPSRRADLLARAVTDDVRILLGAGNREIRGRAQLEVEIVALQRRVPVVRVRLTSGVDVQGSRRFTGVAEAADGPIGQEAWDAGECDASGRIRLLLSFVGGGLPPVD